MNDAILAAIREVAAIPAERRLWSLATILDQRLGRAPAQIRHIARQETTRTRPRAPDAPDPHKEAEILAQHRERR